MRKGLAVAFRACSSSSPPLKGWRRIRELWRKHGVAFVATYSTAYIATYIPIFGAIEIGGLDGPALCSSIITYVGLQNYIDIAWITENPYLSKDGVNALIAMELNGWGDFLRLPAVLHATPYVSKKLEGLRKQS